MMFLLLCYLDTAGESGLTQFLMNEVTRLQKALQNEHMARLEVSARATEQLNNIRKLQTHECELRKQQERVQRMREERDQLWNQSRRLWDENYKLMGDVNRLSEEKNTAIMSNRDLQLEVRQITYIHNIGPPGQCIFASSVFLGVSVCEINVELSSSYHLHPEQSNFFRL